GLILFTVTSLLYFVHLGTGFLIVTRLLHGMTLGLVSTAAGTIVAQIIPMSRKGEGIGYFSMSATMATAIGPFIGLFMSQRTSFETIFALCLALGVISFLISLLVQVPPLEEAPKGDDSKGFKLSN